MTDVLPPALHAKVVQLAADLGLTVEEFIVETVAGRVETMDFFKKRAAGATPGDLTRFLDAAPDVPPFPGDEIPADVAERIEALRWSERNDS